MQKLTGAKAKLGSVMTNAVTVGVKILTGSATTTYNVVDSDYLILAGATGGSIDIKLPTVLGNAGRVIVVDKTTGGGAITLLPTGSEPITDNGGSATSFTVEPNFPAWLICSGSTLWGWRRFTSSTSV